MSHDEPLTAELVTALRSNDAAGVGRLLDPDGTLLAAGAAPPVLRASFEG